jgi:hypothetical protein
VKPTKPYALLGNYRTPRFRYGRVVYCELRGQVELCGLSNGRIPWPIGKRGRNKGLVLYGALLRAVKLEASLAVCYWWGVATDSVWRWRKAFCAPRCTVGAILAFREQPIFVCTSRVASYPGVY